MERTTVVRLYTELKNVETIKALALEVSSGFTMYPAKGVWNNQEENCVVLEFISAENDLYNKCKKLAEKIRTVNDQEAVLLTIHTVFAELLD